MSIRAQEAFIQRQADASGIYRSFRVTLGVNEEILDLESLPQTRRYTPFDQVQITVFDGENAAAIDVGINQHLLTSDNQPDVYMVPVGAQLVLEDQAIRFIKLEHADTAVAGSTAINVRVGRTPITVDKIQQRRIERRLNTV